MAQNFFRLNGLSRYKIPFQKMEANMFGGKLGIPELLILGIIFWPVWVIGWWKIFAKAGQPGILSLAMLVPILNFILFLWFAFSTWPIEKHGPIQPR